MSGVCWSLVMCFDLLRANLKLLRSFRRPALIFTAENVIIQGLNNMQIGAFSRIARFSRITAWKRGRMHIGKSFSLGEFSIIENGFNIAALKGEVVIGNNVGIGAYCFISAPTRVSIGSDCIIGQYFSIHAQNHNFSGSSLIRQQGTSEKGVEIGGNCWIGAKVTILDGVKIGEGCIIAAGAVVTRSFPAKHVIGGCPARVIKSYG